MTFISIPHTLSEVTDADRGINPLLFGTDPADTGNRINLEIEVRILMHFWLSLDALADIMLSLNAI